MHQIATTRLLSDQRRHMWVWPLNERGNIRWKIAEVRRNSRLDEDDVTEDSSPNVAKHSLAADQCDKDTMYLCADGRRIETRESDCLYRQTNMHCTDYVRIVDGRGCVNLRDSSGQH